MNQIVEKSMLEDLFYLLAGFDTQNTFITSNPLALNSINNPDALRLFKPFEFLIFKIREFYAREEFDLFVKEYLEKIARLKTSNLTFEELYVSLQDDIEIFKDLDKILETFKSLNIEQNTGKEEISNNISLINSRNISLFNNKNLLLKVSPSIIKRFQSQEAIELLYSINKWINQANPTTLIEILTPEGFNSCYWANLFKIRTVDLPKKELEGIEEAGKVIFFCRVLFGIELVNDENFEDRVYEKRRNKSGFIHQNRPLSDKQFMNVNNKPDGNLTQNDSFNGQCNGHSSFEDNSCNKRKNKEILNYTKKLNIEEHIGVNQDEPIDFNDSRNENNCIRQVYCPECKQFNRRIIESKGINQCNCSTENNNLKYNSTIPNSPISLLSPNNHPLTNNLQSQFKSMFEPFYYKNDISQRRNQLINSFSSIISQQMKREISLIENLVLLQNNNLFTEVFDSFRKHFFTEESIVNKINIHVFEFNDAQGGMFNSIKIGNRQFSNKEFVQFTDCDSSLGSYVMKLLKSQQEPQTNHFLTNFQRIGIEFGPNSLIKYFVPEKTFIELKIIFRFLFLVNSSIFFLQESKTFNFSRVIYLILLKIKEDRIDLTSEFFINNKNLNRINEINDSQGKIHFMPNGLQKEEQNTLNSSPFNGPSQAVCKSHCNDCGNKIKIWERTTLLNENDSSRAIEPIQQSSSNHIPQSDSLLFSIDSFNPKFSILVTDLLKKFYLTSTEVFPYWSSLLEVAYDFLSIEYKECIIVSDFNQRTKACVLGLILAITKNYGENDFTEYLKNLEVEKYL